MPYFLTQADIYRILQRELPEGVYPDGAPDAYNSTADMYALAGAVSGVYASLGIIYNNFFPQSSVEQLTDWEIKVFGAPLPAGLSIADRQARIINQSRQDISISQWDMLLIVNSYVPPGTFTQIIVFSGGSTGSEGWVLDVGQLDFTTPLGIGSPELYFGENACDQANADYLNPATRQQVIDARNQAYSYQVRIFGYTQTADELANMTLDLQTLGPARSDFTVIQNQNLATYFLTGQVTNVTRESNINCIAYDTSSLSGYTGRVRQ